MATNDIKISELPDIGSNHTDNSLFVITEAGATFNITRAELKNATAFNITALNEEDETSLSDSSEFTFYGTAMNKITLANLMAYINDHIVYPKRQRASMRLQTSVQQTINDSTPEVLTAFDTVVTSTSEFTVDPATNSITYDGPGVSSAVVSVGLNIAFSGTEELDAYLYINGTEYSSVPLRVRGAGTNKPSELYWESDIALNPGDVLDIRGKNADASGSYTITYLRSTFRIDIDYNL